MLLPDWKNIAKKAWSVRLMALASVLSGCEAVLPYAEFILPRGSFATVVLREVIKPDEGALEDDGGHEGA